jgi:hypothetical protein
MSARASILLLATIACGASPSESQTSATNGIDVSSSSSSSDSSSSSTGEPGDPDYPRPEPVDMNGTCPGVSFGPITFEGSSWVCIPECGDGGSCPVPATGTAEAACASAPLSSATPCATSADCTVDGEMCGNAGGGDMRCLLPPTHCILRCDAERVCPDAMVCTIAGVCAYAP